MSWMGKLFGGGLGFALGGPLGAVLGAMTGHFAFDQGKAGETPMSSLEQRQGVYFVATFSMLAKLAKGDGRISRAEIDVIERVMRQDMKLSTDARRFAIEIFNRAKDSDDRFEDYALQFYQAFYDAPEILRSMLQLLLMVALADGKVHREEERLLRVAAETFLLDDEFAGLHAGMVTTADDIERHYRVLGCQPGDDLETVRKRYRRLVMEHHPDRIQARGMPEEFAAVAEEKFKEIQRAWEAVERDIGSKG